MKLSTDAILTFNQSPGLTPSTVKLSSFVFNTNLWTALSGEELVAILNGTIQRVPLSKRNKKNFQYVAEVRKASYPTIKTLIHDVSFKVNIYITGLATLKALSPSNVRVLGTLTDSASADRRPDLRPVHKVG
jgi:hypothetical protein